MASKINVILEARGRDKGVRKQLRDYTKLADGLAESLKKVDAAGQGIGSMSAAGPIAAPGRRRASRPRASGGRSPARQQRSRANAEREFDRALDKAIKEQRSIARSLEKQDRAQRRAAKNIANMTDEQLEAVELEREMNRRRRRMARRSAEERLGADPSLKGRGAAGRFENAENLSAAAGEFEQLADRAEEGVRGSLTAFKDYQKGVTEVSTLTDQISVEDISTITKNAAEEFGGLPTEQVSAFYAIVSAGATNASEAQEQLVAANKLAIAGVASQEESVLAISKSVANFGVTSAQASDILFASVQKGQNTVSDLAKAVPQAANAAATTGLSMEDLAASVSFLSTKLPDAQAAAVGLSAAFSNIQKPTEQARKEAKKLGIDFSVAGVEAAGGWEEFLLQLRDSEEFSAESIGRLFDSSQARKAIGSLVDDMEGFNSTLTQTEKSAGSTSVAYNKMADTAAQRSAKFDAQLELLKISAGEALLPALTELAEVGMSFVEQLTDLTESAPITSKVLGGMALAGIGLARAFSGVASAMSMYNTIQGIAATKTAATTAATTAGATSATKYGVATKGMSAAVGALPAIMAGSAIAIAAFEATLNQARKPLEKYEETIQGIANEQDKISFKGADGEDKSEAELLNERRNRLIRTANAANAAARASRLGGVDEDAGGLRKLLGAGTAGALNIATGVSGDLERQARQAEIDLARFDQQFADQIGLAPEQRVEFENEPGAIGGASDLLATAIDNLARVTEQQANSQPWWMGPSMEAGEV